MISLEEIDSEILTLEKKDTSYAVVERLAWLYIVRDHLRAEQIAMEQTIGSSGSDFLDMVNGMDINAVLPIMDELMDTLKVVCAKCYESVMGKLEKAS